jgi:hypothetical protein
MDRQNQGHDQPDQAYDGIEPSEARLSQAAGPGPAGLNLEDHVAI